ncbi:MAG: hypothetical protein RL291_2059, partial [Pseudomonadota bacterium]
LSITFALLAGGILYSLWATRNEGRSLGKGEGAPPANKTDSPVPTSA